MFVRASDLHRVARGRGKTIHLRGKNVVRGDSSWTLDFLIQFFRNASNAIPTRGMCPVALESIHQMLLPVEL